MSGIALHSITLVEGIRGQTTVFADNGERQRRLLSRDLGEHVPQRDAVVAHLVLGLRAHVDRQELVHAADLHAVPGKEEHHFVAAGNARAKKPWSVPYSLFRCAMRRVPHAGQKPRRLQLNATSFSCAQSAQRRRRNPWASAVVLQVQSVTDLIAQFRLCVHPASIDKVYQPGARNGA